MVRGTSGEGKERVEDLVREKSGGRSLGPFTAKKGKKE